ncbi:MAG: PH domain-containing protein [Planctomycetes bacterium]|nr:PH domain-containing protein [Planctomycetota bacterium]
MNANAPDPVLGLTGDRAAALLPADLLQGDETIILLLKPSPLYILLSCVGTLGVIIVLTMAALWVHRHLGLGEYDPSSLMTLAVGLMGLRLFWQFLEWMSRTYVLTDRRVIRIKGVLRVEVFQAELGRIQHTDVIMSVRERLFGLGTISFATAGTGFPEAYWLMLRRPYTVQKQILQAIHRYR